ncbi:unnamed protein product [Dibothriocephalus latus]|uniref:RRM domain-containing protein n=1 Tax=Dibothriocephalus latus TaxID=60516 RepID=A0A3P7LKA4_DIBLA|nr:unnamed protein product [Dibothriocephalus latus]
MPAQGDGCRRHIDKSIDGVLIGGPGLNQFLTYHASGVGAYLPSGKVKLVTLLIGSQLLNLHLLVDQGSGAVATGVIMCSQSHSQHPTFSVASSLKPSERTEHKFDREPLLSKHQLELTKQIASSSTHCVQQQKQSKQQQKDLQDGWAVGRSQQRRIELVVSGVKANITAEDLKAHFASFGEVLDVAMCINPKTNRHNGAGHITLRSTVDVNQILDAEHIILDVRINVRKSKRHLEIYVDGVQAQLTADNLKTHFASFGEVLDIYMCINPKKKKHNGSGYLTLRPTVYWNQVIDAEHIIRGVRINVKDCR